MSILIKGGRVIDPAEKTDEVLDVLINDEGAIEKKGKRLTAKTDEVVEAKGCFVLPGLVDLHEHLRDPGQEYKEDVLTAAAAAAKGGFTTIVAMPNTVPVVDNADVVDYVHHKAEGSLIRVLQAGAVTRGMKGEALSDIEGMVAAGAPAITEDGRTVMDSALYLEAMKKAKALDIPVFAHCEDMNLARGGVMNDDENARAWGFRGIPGSAEDLIVTRDLMLARDSGVRLHLLHCSTADSVELIKVFRKRKVRVTAEVTPHHFTLTSSDIDPKNANFKMNPPLRTREDRDALRKALQDGTLDVIATDHAPHSFEDKNFAFAKAPFGVIGSETALAVTYTELVLGKVLTLSQMVEKMSLNPARIIGSQGGTLKVGAPADVTVFDPAVAWTVDASRFLSKSRNTPFQGRSLMGQVACTICGGRVAYRK